MYVLIYRFSTPDLCKTEREIEIEIARACAFRELEVYTHGTPRCTFDEQTRKSNPIKM